jgi:transcriptional regulator with XRE-family HTH domain
MTQADVARRSGVSRNKVSFIETGCLDRVSLHDLRATLAAMDAWLDVRIHRRGADLDRLLDEGHARLVGEVSRWLRERGWQVETEVTFSEFGERGSIDVLAWHEGRRVLLVIEIKTELGSVDGLLRPLDIKVRHASQDRSRTLRLAGA